MPNATDYVARLEQATSTASGHLSSIGYADPISRKPLYSVKTVLPRVRDVNLTLEGKFLLGGEDKTNPLIVADTGAIELSPEQLLEYVIKTAQQQGNILPSYIAVGKPLEQQIEGLLEHLVHEIEVLPQVVDLERQGMLSETRKLLGAGR